MVPLEAVMREADFVVVCCLLNEETRHLIDARKLALMKPTAYYLNMGRGPIHDEKALAEVLKAGRIAGAGLDVTEREPIEPESRSARHGERDHHAARAVLDGRVLPRNCRDRTAVDRRCLARSAASARGEPLASRSL